MLRPATVEGNKGLMTEDVMAQALERRARTTATAAEQVVDRLDSYSQAQHAELLKAARIRAQAKQARRERARAAAARLRSAS